MKRVWIAIALIFVSIILCLWEQMEINSFCDTVATLTSEEKIKNSPNDSAREIKKLWDEKNDTLYAFSQHDLLEHLAENIEQLENNNDLETKLYEIRAQNNVYYENHRMTFSNIF